MPSTAAQLHVPRKHLENTLDRVTVHSLARERAVEIDNVQVLRTGLRKQHGLRGGIVTVNGGAIHIALGKAHDFAVLQVDGGKDDHERSSG